MKTASARLSSHAVMAPGDHPKASGFAATALYRLKLIGLGTPQCESAVSYLCGLANAHHVPVDALVNDVLTRFCHEDLSIWRHFSTWSRGAAINIFTRSRTMVLLSALKGATGMQELDRLSLAALNEAVDLRGSSSGDMRHCPACYRKVTAPTRAHRPLIWDLQLVRVCPVHRTPLVSSTCQATSTCILSTWSRHHIPGICPTCGSIGFRCCGVSGLTVDDADIWIANELGRVVAHVTAGERFKGEDVRESVVRLASLIGEGRPYRAARLCGISKARLFDWINGKKQIRLSPLVAICAVAGVGVVEALRGEIATGGQPVQHKHSCVRDVRIRVDPSERSEVMRRAVVDVTCPSLSSVARSLGISTKYLSQCFPAQAGEVVRRHREARSSITEKRQLEANRMMAALAEELKAEGLQFTKRNVWLRRKVMVTSQSRFEAAWMKVREVSESAASSPNVQEGD